MKSRFLIIFKVFGLAAIMALGIVSILGTGGDGGDGQTFTLTVTMNDAGNGRVSTSPEGIFCETDCSEAYSSGTQVTLAATPYSGFIFTGWSGGDCSGTGTCTLTINANTSVTATFDPGGTDPLTLVTPYVDEADMAQINIGFSTEVVDPWNNVHDGLDIYPAGDLKPFQAAFSGRVDGIFTGDDMVDVLLTCNSTHMLEYTFEPQFPGTGQTQLDNIVVVEGQTVSQGDIIGYLYVADVNAHVHFALYENWVTSCPESYFSLVAGNSILNLIHVVFPDYNNMCYGAVFTPPPLVTPYVNESDMTEINAGFSSDNSSSPWDFVNDGLDIYPAEDLKPFQAVCSGIVDSVQLIEDGAQSNWQTEVLIECDNYVFDPSMGGYFSPFLVNYVFKTMSTVLVDGQTQLGNITVVEGQVVSQGDIIGYLYAANVDAHVHFGLLQFGALSYFGLPSIPICPGPHFATDAKNSILNLLNEIWPSANICYQN